MGKTTGEYADVFPNITKYRRLYPKIRLSHTLLEKFRKNAASFPTSEEAVRYLLGIRGAQGIHMELGSYAHDFMDSTQKYPHGLKYLFTGENRKKLLAGDFETEKKLVIPFGEYSELVAQPDMILGDALVDYKTGTSTPKPSQLQLYHYILSRAGYNIRSAVFVNIDLIVNGYSVKALMEEAKISGLVEYDLWARQREIVHGAIASDKQKTVLGIFNSFVSFAGYSLYETEIEEKARNVERLILGYLPELANYEAYYIEQGELQE